MEQAEEDQATDEKISWNQQLECAVIEKQRALILQNSWSLAKKKSKAWKEWIVNKEIYMKCLIFNPAQSYLKEMCVWNYYRFMVYIPI